MSKYTYNDSSNLKVQQFIPSSCECPVKKNKTYLKYKIIFTRGNY